MSIKRKMRRGSNASGPLLEIVHGAMDQAWVQRLPAETRDALPMLYERVREDPRSAVMELRAWIAREPLPMFFNWLSAAYRAVGDVQGADDTIRENYQRNPQYLFARVNYAEMCLRDGDLDDAREALGGGLDIRALLGGRKRVHVTEFAGYYFAVGRYHIRAGDLAAAEKVCGMMEEAAPTQPPTRELRAMLHPRLRDRLAR